MEILFAATELAPFVKVGGLADVAAALPKALRALGHKVTVVLPRFPAFEAQGLIVARRLTPLRLELGGKTHDVTVFDGRLASQVDIVLVDAPGLFDRESFYGDDEDAALRTGVFSRAVAELARQRADAERPFDVVHLSDWPTALVAAFLANVEATRTVLTVHNAAHQGLFPRAALAQLGLGDADFDLDGAEFYGKVSALKLGVLRAHVVTTVSATYARELQTSELGHGLEGVFRQKPLVGIANGIDYSIWNPATDGALPSRYDSEEPSGKVRARGAFLREVGLPVEIEPPLVGFVGRLVDQKGVDLVLGALPQLLRASDARVVVCGDGEPAIVSALRDAVKSSADRVAFVHAAPEPLVHRLFAAADFVMVPSRREPCGLVQLYAQRYGAIPIARATGGLVDTVIDCDASLETGTGFLFQEATVEGLLGATLRALAARATPSFEGLVRRVMRLDRSWDGPARRYEAIYRNITGKR